MGVSLISYATRRQPGMEARAEEDRINDFGRDPIGEGKDERVSLVCGMIKGIGWLIDRVRNIIVN